MNNRLMARLKGTCSITVDGDGNVTGSQPALTARAGEEVTANQPTPEMSATGAPRDPAAPPETDSEKAARVAAERAAETPEQTTTREAAEAEETRRAALTDEQRTAEDTAKAAADLTAKDKAWAERDVTKDVPVTAEQKADIAKLASTPDQIAAMERFTLETNTTNDLSPASRAEAAKLWGVTPDMVDRYVESVITTNNAAKLGVAQYDDNSDDQSKWSPALQGQFKARMDALEGVAGGKENWEAFSGWAEQNLKPEQMSALQAAISASPIVGATVAKEMIATWRAQGNGGGPTDLSRGTGMAPQNPARVGPQPFATKDEQNAAINDPRYSRDAAYRSSVDARMVVSNFAANNVEKSFYAGAGSMMGG